MGIHVKGNIKLAEALGVHKMTIQKWKKEGLLNDAMVVNFRRTIIYDLDKVYQCLQYKPLTKGRKKAI